ncbi:unnamed protein product [Brachionus calyciflorus]|uniref:WD and tetratricopeptide repeats protein 1 n=1 Tax=Brachionus calyciflorus TaxID=104777 RepID=A0A814B2T2_9BILA|nr:unnamed protein product [Brachionus calyciflorus]
MSQNTFLHDLYYKELDSSYFRKFKSKNVFSRSIIEHMNLDYELQGHSGCVNCLEWNQSGSILASGSDDLKIILWDPFRRKELKRIETKHRGNIFGVKFLPYTGDTLIASAAADRDIYVHDINKNVAINEIHAHQNRVKRLETAQDTPFLFWSCGEDGYVLQHDIRCKPSEITSLLLNYSTSDLVDSKHSEVKCVCINQARSEQIAIGLSDPYARVYDRRMMQLRAFKNRNTQNSQTTTTSTSVNSAPKYLFEYSLLNDADPSHVPLTYYVPGHLPKRIDEYHRRMKTLSITFISFSPNGKELLVNLGGEQLYLYDLDAHNNLCNQIKFDSYKKLFDECDYTVVSSTTKTSTNETSSESEAQKQSKKKAKLPPKAEELKAKANASFEEQNYVEAIEFYNQAIQIAENSPILYGNRAATLMKRNWDGDIYSAIKDCYTALTLDKTHLKSHFRLAKCLNDLKWHQEAKECIEIFAKRFPDYAKSQACENLIKEIDKALKNQKKKTNENSDEEENGSDVEWTTMSESENESNDSINKKQKLNKEESIETLEKNKKIIKIYQHKKLNSIDFQSRFCGHCNVSTDIKEANFVGENFVAAGSDDGSFFIWDKKTTNIIRVLKGDESIVNCIQTHPYSCYMATSGIDNEVRIWAPNYNEKIADEYDRVITDVKSTVLNNQVKMNSHPFEYLFLNYSQNNWNSDETGNQNVECRPS